MGGRIGDFPCFFCLVSDPGSAYISCVTLDSVCPSLNLRLVSVTRGDRPTDPPGPSGPCSVRFQGWKFLIYCPPQSLTLVSCNPRQVFGFIQIPSIMVGEPGKRSQPTPKSQSGVRTCAEGFCSLALSPGTGRLDPLPHILIWSACLASVGHTSELSAFSAS